MPFLTQVFFAHFSSESLISYVFFFLHMAGYTLLELRKKITREHMLQLIKKAQLRRSLPELSFLCRLTLFVRSDFLP
jgi:hypothetical protein